MGRFFLTLHDSYHHNLNYFKLFVFQPKFLTKEERAAEALKKRQEQVEAQRKKVEVINYNYVCINDQQQSNFVF